ncbi:MAG: M28 family peptidase [Saprospiraceae bacterium]|nr:M28 family peptidase [Saprospiraceae bacterium]
MKKSISLLLAGHLALALHAQNEPPIIQTFTVNPDWANLSLQIQYEVTDAENDPLEVQVQFSHNGGKDYSITGSVPVSGDVGFPVQPGTRNIQCDIAALANLPASFLARLVVDDKQTFDLQWLVDQVDSTRIRADLEYLEGVRHRTAGLAQLKNAQDTIRNLFLAQGLVYEEQAVPFGNYTGKNLIGNLPGTAFADKVVINDAHYDTVSNAPGADDNGSGTVGFMEAARLLSPYPFKKTLRFIGFDLEESGLLGSIRYVNQGIPAGETIEGVFNHEMIGYWSNEPNSQTLPQGFSLLFPAAAATVAANQYRGDFITNVGNTNSQPLALLFSNTAQQYVPDLKVLTLDVPGNGQLAPDLRRSDHTPFWEAGKQALMLTDGANFRNECYHTPGDTLDEKLNFTFLSNVVKATIASMAQLAEIQHGDWAAASFANNVSTSTAGSSCELFAYQQDGQSGAFHLQIRGCAVSEIAVSLLDMKGSVVLEDTYAISESDLLNVHTPILPPGVYVLKVRFGENSRSQKILLR